ncbi:MAG: hypothetical protein H0U59_07320 [Gemmatimonadaceae bacterium]|nr:hypothetical protein [Gemmatimonadaceae bacterium]
MSDARTTFPKTQFVPVMMSYDEQDAGNPFHLLLIAGSAVALVLFRRGRATMVPLALIAAVVAGSSRTACISGGSRGALGF